MPMDAPGAPAGPRAASGRSPHRPSGIRVPTASDLDHLRPRDAAGLLFVAWCAGLTTLALLLSTAFLVEPSAPVALALLVACGVAMVSVIPVPRPQGVGLAAFVGWALVLVVIHGVSTVR